LRGSTKRSAVLRFFCQPYPDGAGARVSDGSLHATLDEAIAACESVGGPGRMFVFEVNPDMCNDPSSDVPTTDAALNQGDAGYLTPESIVASGGYVVRRAGDGVELLLIYRRGEWDLPKGKLERDEEPGAGAEREVAEEVGVPHDMLRRGRYLGRTQHGYPHPRRPTYAVKTTHWYSFTTSAESFTPQAEEDIEEVRWVPWADAGAMLGFETLRMHHAGLDPNDLGV